MKNVIAFLLACLVAPHLIAGEFRITASDRNGSVSWENAARPGVVTLQTAPAPEGPWQHGRNYFNTSSVSQATVPLPGTNLFVRLLSADISGTSQGFTNLVQAYGILETVAGKGQYATDKRNNWLASYEGGPATNANLSRPHNGFVDPQGNLYLVDEGSSSILKVTPDGNIRTFAGTHVNGNNGDGPDYATNLHLHYPNGGWLAKNGTFFVLDTYNGKVRRVDTNGIMRTVFTTTAPINEGRGLWVTEDESTVYFCTGTDLKRWTEARRVVESVTNTTGTQFLDLGNIIGDDAGNLYIPDRDINKVYRLSLTNDILTRVAGNANGTTTGGGAGFPANQTGLNRPRTICFLPGGGYFIGEHSPGNRVWYVDPAGIIHLWLNGSDNTRHPGDGQWFFTPDARVSKIRFLSLDHQGNLIITENDYGYVRRVNFHRL